MPWNGHDPRAVVASAELHTTRDVVSSDSALATASPYPLGFGVYTCREDELGDKKPLPMFYVSPAVARDRSPGSHPANAGGVEPGWYVLAQAGTHFEIHVTKVNQRPPGASHEIRLSTDLYVDGQCANHPMGFSIDGQGSEHWATGFVERRKRDGNGGLERTVRKFAFEKASTVEEVDGDPTQSEAGSIRLSVEVGRAVRTDGYRAKDSRYNYCKRDVSEKEVAKLGRSLKVRCDGKVGKQKRMLSRFVMADGRHLPEATVVVFVREPGWMRSRRLVDDNGIPCTFESYKKLLRQDNGLLEDEPVGVKPEMQITGHVAKRIGCESAEVVHLDDDDLEVIDLL